MKDEISKIWFIYSHETVTGPFTVAEINEKLKSDSLVPSDLIWCRGHREWEKVRDWKGPSPVAAPPSGAQFYVLVNGLNSGPYEHQDIVEKLKNKEFPLTTTLWTEGLTHWVTVYETPSMVDQIGLARRRYPRVPFVGNVHLTAGDQVLDVIGISLSEGGMAIKNLKDVEVGQEISLSVDSPLLTYPIYAKAIVMYRKPSEMGLQFSQLSTESRGAVIEYAKQFENRGKKSA